MKVCYLLVALLTFGASAAVAANLESVRTFDIKPQRLETALIEFSKQAGLQVIGATATVADTQTGGVSGKLTSRVALNMLLQNTSLVFNPIGTHSVQIVPAKRETTSHEASDATALRLARMDPPSTGDARGAAEEEESQDAKGVPEMLVKGRRSLNTDIVRSEDDPQPYVIFDGKEISRSQALNLEEFLRTRLPMNAASGSSGQATGSASNVSSIDLRGLGQSQTLILVDGRRMPGIWTLGNKAQPDINGIPLSAVERVEVLPSTAGGIYGGSATGGVVNIVLRRDFSGLEARANYANTFDSDAANTRVDINAGLSLEGGRTRVMFSAARAEANNLTVGDRDFTARSNALQMKNDPAAITGAALPPLGATVNIRSVTGNLVLDTALGGTNLGSAITHIPLGYAGPASDSGAALVRNAGKFNMDLSNDMNGRGRGLMSAPAMQSATLNVRREFSSRVEAFVDFSTLGNNGSSFTANVPNAVANLAGTAPNNPFQGNIRVRFPTPDLAFESRTEATTLRGTGGIIVRLPGNWTGEADYGWSRSRFETVATAAALNSAASTSLNSGVGAGGLPALNALQEANTFPIDFTPYLLETPNNFVGPFDATLKNITLRASGPLLQLPAGPLTVSALVESRDEALHDGIVENRTAAAASYTFYPERTQDVKSGYVELRAPLFSRALELQLSARHDEYRTRSDGAGGYALNSRDAPRPALTYITNELTSTDYTFGLRYQPIEDVTLRASVGTGFLPASVTQIVPSIRTGVFSFGADPKRDFNNTSVGQQVTLISGGSAGLKPENSESWSAGVIFTPRFAPALRLSVDFTQIDKVDEIQTPSPQFLLQYEAQFRDRIIRGPKLSTDLAHWEGPIISFNQSLLNVATTKVQAYDFQLDYLMETAGRGEFRWYAIVSRQPHFRSQTLPILPEADRAGFVDGPLEWRGNAGVTWERNALTLGWNTQYYNSYYIYGATYDADFRDSLIRGQGADTVPSQMYHDLIATYRLDAFNSEISFGIQNVFDRSPPILASALTSAAGYSQYGDPRLRRYSISLRKSFD